MLDCLDNLGELIFVDAIGNKPNCEKRCENSETFDKTTVSSTFTFFHLFFGVLYHYLKIFCRQTIVITRNCHSFLSAWALAYHSQRMTTIMIFDREWMECMGDCYFYKPLHDGCPIDQNNIILVERRTSTHHRVSNIFIIDGNVFRLYSVRNQKKRQQLFLVWFSIPYHFSRMFKCCFHVLSYYSHACTP